MASRHLNVVAVFHEQKALIQPRQEHSLNSQILVDHLDLRLQSELDFFGLYLDQDPVPTLIKEVREGWLSSDECLDELRQHGVDLIMVYGSSIIKGDILNRYHSRILNLHLGLSPYYRGSGTNFFPFVNNEPEYAGATFMYLDAGVDTGPIIHQIRPELSTADSFHQLSNRFLIRAFNIYIQIAEGFSDVTAESESYRDVRFGDKRLLYRRSDFTPETVEMLSANFRDGMIESYLAHREERISKAPIKELNILRDDI